MKKCLIAAVLAAVPVAASAQAVDGFYVGAGIGPNRLQNEPVPSFTVAGQSFSANDYSFGTGYAAMVSLGYGLGSGLRLEVEGSDYNNRVRQAPVAGQQAGVTLPGAHYSGQESKYGLMGNILYDIDIPIVHPYLGAGLGFQTTDLSESLGSTLISATRGGIQPRPAYQAIVGLALPIGSGFSLTADFRTLGLIGNHTLHGTRLLVGTSFSQPVSVQTNSDNNQQIMFGVRYAFGGH